MSNVPTTQNNSHTPGSVGRSRLGLKVVTSTGDKMLKRYSTQSPTQPNQSAYGAWKTIQFKARRKGKKNRYFTGKPTHYPDRLTTAQRS